MARGLSAEQLEIKNIITNRDEQRLLTTTEDLVTATSRTQFEVWRSLTRLEDT